MHNETVLDLTFAEKVLIIIIPPIVGALLGWLIHIPAILEWIAKLPFIPFQEVLEWAATLDSHWVSVVSTCLGIIAGIIFTLFVFHEIVKITIRDDEVKIQVKGNVNSFRYNEISA
ncbi:50S ribosomal protein L29, partial [Gracilibacillus oryzae]